MDWIVLLFALELGFAPSYSSINKVDNMYTVYNTEDSAYVLFEVEAEVWEHIFIGGGIKTWIQGTEEYANFHPYQADYMFNSGLRFKNIDIGWRHMCLHPIRPLEWSYAMSDTSDGSYNELYIRVSN